MAKDPTCNERIDDALASTVETLEALLEQERTDPDGYHDEHGNLNEYGLSFDYKPKDEDNENGYFCFLMSWGGPSDELRFYADLDGDLYKVEYWFLDWFDGASRTVYLHDGERPDWVVDLWAWFEPSVDHCYREATQADEY